MMSPARTEPPSTRTGPGEALRLGSAFALGTVMGWALALATRPRAFGPVGGLEPQDLGSSR